MPARLMVALTDVRRWDPAGLADAFTTLGLTRDHLLDLDDDLRAARPGDQEWQGIAGDAARSVHDRMATALGALVADLTAARPMLADAVDTVAALASDLARADALAAARGFAIGPDGSVADIRVADIRVADIRVTDLRPAGSVADRTERLSARAEIVELVRRVLERATAIDAVLLAGLRRASREAAAGSDLRAAAVAAVPAQVGAAPPGGTPARDAAWWRSLGPVAREETLLLRPDLIGDLDGLPATVRDEANRAQLPGERARIDAELAAATHRYELETRSGPRDRFAPGAIPERQRLRAEIAALADQHDALVAVAQTVARPERQLLLLDIEGHAAPRAAVAAGDVDTAAHVAVFTPGFTSTVAGGLPTYVDDMAALRQVARGQLTATGHGDGVAAVVWLGYDAPQWDTIAVIGHSVAGATDAEAGGLDLARFDDGITEARPGHRPHLTALGHSYGSTTTGFALQHTTDPVDDAVVFGSPGLGTSDLRALHVPAGHVAVLEAPWDPVADLAVFGRDPNHLDGVVDLSARDATDPDGTALRGSIGHGAYLDNGTTSQFNIAVSVAGLPDRRILGSNDGIGDLLLPVRR